ncbi:MAG TPA: head maturation protease, ClpP-related [Burkholderiaceae bacterium]|nr:head maturation protease, ClpP-related [Burkholderiaceae bacterium]
MKTFRKDKTAIAFSAKADGGALTLEIYDAIGADFFGDGITATSVSSAIAQAGKFASITVRLNSPGGDLFEGVAIYNLLRAAGKPVNVVVDGLAASAASLIACAGDTITMGLGTQYMLHEALAMTAGYASDMRKMADTLDSVSSSAADIYVAKTGLAKDKVLALMAAETWYGPEDAVANGFATSVSASKATVTNSFDLSVFKNTPIELQTKTKEVDGEHLDASDFIYAGDKNDTSTWSLPWHFSTEAKTVSHLRDALARFDQDEIIPAADRPRAHGKLVRIAKEHGIDVEVKSNEADDNFLIDILRKRVEVEKRR